ncbi:helix-turn-helix transcriptional regulator (plasmid) [Cupriavidus sp. P-10]|uniref:helix-turn-helix transcriptional regulator n=2 Tax=Cupriavidus TaxID=106589 RepID=UPI0013146983|nr:helix-turn-helix transcriptional regulator [Cupriavidus sp. P-10]BDB28911.1 helix-turn-helix transcriptional regulator [Cupriavidus sp. P-10]
MLFFEPSNGPNFAVATGFIDEHARRIQQEFATRMPDWIESIPVGAVMRQTSVISDADFRRTDLYQDALRPADAFYGIIAPLARTPERRILLSAGRNLGERDFTEEDVGAFRMLVPHLLTALAVRHRIEAADLQGRWALEVFGQLNVGVILVDVWMRPVFANARAEMIAAVGDGLLLREQGISSSTPAESKLLSELVARAIAFNHLSRDASEGAIHHPALRCHLSRRQPRPPLLVTVVPVQDACRLNGVSNATRAILFVVDPDVPPGAEPIHAAEMFDLTQRESELAAMLASGLALTDVASQLGITIGTARGYLKHVLAKTGTHRQGELVSLLLRGQPVSGDSSSDSLSFQRP